MEAALVSGLIKAILPKLISLAHDKYKLNKGVKGDIRFLDKELRMIVGAIDDELSLQIEDQGAVPRLSNQELCELSHRIEDCIDTLLYRAAWKKHSSFLSRTVRPPKTLLTHNQLAEEMRRLRRSAEEAHQRKQRYTHPGHGRQTSSAPRRTDESSSLLVSDPRIPDADLVGVDGHRADLLEQLAEAEGQPKQLKVVAIVGFCGSGKTALAAQIYNKETGDGRFEKHAWVSAAHKRSVEVLADMLRKLTANDAASSNSLGISDINLLCVHLREQLDKKRYFIVIDDIQTEDQWKNIRLAFPNENDFASRIVVTTTIQSVGNACSSANGYVHRMTRLDEECSKQLFSKKACPHKYLDYKQPDSIIAIMKICDGQPLALVTLGEFLQTKGWPTGPNFQDVCKKLHYHLENDGIFGEMRRMLIRNYTTLPGHALKACLLYFCMFPSNHPIRRKCLLRRWVAEGFVESQTSSSSPDSAIYFDMLLDRNIIEPINVSNNEKVKTCQTYGMMHEFILHISISQNFVTLLRDENTEHEYVRRLSLHQIHVADNSKLNNINLSLVRSLTIFGEANEAVLDFRKYQLLRVLDLEKCNDLKDDHVKRICNLLLLKYLSIGGNVTRLPRDVSKLNDLEVLIARKTNVAIILPEEVFQLPCLIQLSGKFKLPDQVQGQHFLSIEKSKLEIIAGFVTTGSEGYLHYMGRMRKLRKIKIWCESSADAGSTNWTDVQETIQQFINDKNDANVGDRSLSLHFEKFCEGFLNSLKGPCYLTSLKLHCKLHALPQFVTSLRGLVDLCLSSVKLTTGLLESLTMLGDLKYLKLIADDLEEFIIKDRSFPNLLRLCFMLRHPTFPTIQRGCMPFLSTLQLLCKDLDGLSGIQIEYLKHLKEIVLDHRVTPGTKGKFEKAAKEHPNRPKVLLAKTADTIQSEVIEDSIAFKQDTMKSEEISVESKGQVQDFDTDMLPNRGSYSSVEPERQNSCAVHSSSDHELNPADVSAVPLKVATTQSTKHHVDSNGPVQVTVTQMPHNHLESTAAPKKLNSCELKTSINDELGHDSSNMAIPEASPLNSLSETADISETESSVDSVALICAN